MEIGLDVGARLPLIFVIIIKDYDWDYDDCDLMVMMTQHSFDIGDCACVNWVESDCEDTDDDSYLINHIFIGGHFSCSTFGYSGVAKELCLNTTISCSLSYVIQYIQINIIIIMIVIMIVGVDYDHTASSRLWNADWEKFNMMGFEPGDEIGQN